LFCHKETQPADSGNKVHAAQPLPPPANKAMARYEPFNERQLQHPAKTGNFVWTLFSYFFQEKNVCLETVA